MYRFFLFLFFVALNFSNGISVSSKVDTTSGNIGNIFNWFVRVENHGKSEVVFPELKINDGNVSIRKEHLNENEFFTEKKFEIIFWDTGSFITPNYQVIVKKLPDKKLYIDVPNINIKIAINPNISSDMNLRPIIGPLEIKRPWFSKNNLLVVVMLFLLSLILFISKKRRKASYKKFTYPSLDSPKTFAFKRLDSISQNCSPKDFYSEISHISREFFEKKYFIRSLEMTTDEIAENQKLFSLDFNLFKDWIDILEYADKVKYAKEPAELKKMEKDLANIKSFINSVEN